GALHVAEPALHVVKPSVHVVEAAMQGVQISAHAGPKVEQHPPDIVVAPSHGEPSFPVSSILAEPRWAQGRFFEAATARFAGLRAFVAFAAGAGLAIPRTSARNRPVWDSGDLATTSGGPSATTRPPPSPPSGPRSTIQSAVLMTSRLCSMTRTVLPASTRRCSTPIRWRTSSKWRPVVGSSRM